MAWKELFGTDIGLFSVFTISVVIVIGGFYVRYFTKKMEEDARNQGN